MACATCHAAAPSTRKRTAVEYVSDGFDERPTKNPREAATFLCVFKDCSHSCKHLSLMEIHCRTHTHEKPFHCPAAGCSLTYTQKVNVKKHYDVHHNDCPLSDEVLDFLIEELKVATPAAAALAREASVLATTETAPTTGITLSTGPAPAAGTDPVRGLAPSTALADSDRHGDILSFSDFAPVPSSDSALIARQPLDKGHRYKLEMRGFAGQAAHAPSAPAPLSIAAAVAVASIHRAPYLMHSLAGVHPFLPFRAPAQRAFGMQNIFPAAHVGFLMPAAVPACLLSSGFLAVPPSSTLGFSVPSQEERCSASFRLTPLQVTSETAHPPPTPCDNNSDDERCCFSCRDRATMYRHSLVHSGERPFPCPFLGCRYAGTVRSATVNHYATHQSEAVSVTELREMLVRLPTPLADALVQESESVSSVVVATPSGSSVRRTKREFRCSQTRRSGKNRGFDSRGLLSMARSALDDTVRWCPETGCSYATSARAHMHQHCLSHSCERPFSCFVRGCTYATALLGDAVRHYPRAHADAPLPPSRLRLLMKRKPCPIADSMLDELWPRPNQRRRREDQDQDADGSAALKRARHLADYE